MILKVFADPGSIANHRDAVLLQERSRTDARQLQQLRRLQRAGRENDLATRARRFLQAVLHELERSGATVFDRDPRGLGAGRDDQVWAIFRGPQERQRRAAADAAALVDLKIGDAFLDLAVV